jgi:hypothetical protein
MRDHPQPSRVCRHKFGNSNRCCANHSALGRTTRNSAANSSPAAPCGSRARLPAPLGGLAVPLHVSAVRPSAMPAPGAFRRAWTPRNFALFVFLRWSCRSWQQLLFASFSDLVLADIEPDQREWREHLHRRNHPECPSSQRRCRFLFVE